PCRGPQFFHDVLDAGIAVGARHFLLGGSPETLAALEERIAAEHPGAIVAGTCSPPFRELSARERAEILEEVRAANPDVVWVGLGTPKQDFWSRDVAE